jgi:hypothetical protein
VTKLNATGSALLYSTFLGGSTGATTHGIAVDVGGNAYVTGATDSENFPTTPGAFQPRKAGVNGNAFVTKFNPTGAALVYSSYLGGGNPYGWRSEAANAIAVDVNGNAYVIGDTESDNFPTTPGAFQRTRGPETRAFLSKVNAAGTALAYSTFVGAFFGTSVAVDATGNAYVTGRPGADFPATPGAYDTRPSSAFVAKFTADGTALVYSTFLEDGTISAIAVDPAGNAYVVGATNSPFYPTTPGAFQPQRADGSDATLTKLDPTGSSLLYSTFLGDFADDFAVGVAVNAAGHAYVTGRTESEYFPTTPGAFQPTKAGYYYSGFVSVLATGP